MVATCDQGRLARDSTLVDSRQPCESDSAHGWCLIVADKLLCCLYFHAVHNARDDVLARLRAVLEQQRIVNESDHFSVPLPNGTMARLPCMPMMPLCD